MTTPTNSQSKTESETRTNSPSATSSISITGSVRDWVIGLVLALSLCGNFFAAWRFSRAEQQEDLKRYDLDFFVRNEYQPLKAKVEAHEALLVINGCRSK